MKGLKKIKKGGKAMKSLRDQVLTKALSYMKKEDQEALRKGLKAFLEITKNSNNSKLSKNLKTLFEEGIISEREYKEMLKKINGNSPLTSEETKSIAWVRSQAMLIYKVLQTLKESS